MQIEKTNQAVNYTATATQENHIISADVKTSRDETAIIALNGVIRTTEGEYIGSFAAGENNSALNINSADPAQMTAIASIVAEFTGNLITPKA